jgi:hypothetical protein
MLPRYHGDREMKIPQKLKNYNVNLVGTFISKLTCFILSLINSVKNIYDIGEVGYRSRCFGS